MLHQPTLKFITLALPYLRFNMASPKKITFLDLPREIRDLIYNARYLSPGLVVVDLPITHLSTIAFTHPSLSWSVRLIILLAQ